MADFVTLEQARHQLRTDPEDDSWLEMWIPAVSAAVVLWLKDEQRCYEADLDDEGNPVVLPSVKAAVLIELAAQHRFRDSEGAPVMPATAGHGYVLSQGATALLAPLRRSTVA